MLTSDSAHARQSPPLFWPLLGYLSGKVSIVMASKIKCQSYESGFLLHDLGEVTQPFPASVASPFVMIHTHVEQCFTCDVCSYVSPVWRGPFHCKWTGATDLVSVGGLTSPRPTLKMSGQRMSLNEGHLQG